MAKTKVLFLLESLARGGVQQGILLKAPRLDDAKYETQVWVLRDKKKHWDMEEDFARAGIAVSSVPVRHLGDSRGIIALARKLREQKIELINTRSFLPNLAGRIAARLAGVPVRIANYHHTYAHRWNAKYLACERLLRGETNAFVCVSDAVRRYLEPLLDLPSQRVKVIYNGLDIGRYQIETTKEAVRAKLGLPLNCPIIANIGRLTAVKDVRTFIAAIPAISARFPDALFLIVGDGDERPALEAQAREQNLGQRIRFLGSREDVPEILHAADCVAQSSLLEGLPRIVMEAFASRTPVVTTPAGGVAEIVRDGHNGLIVPFSNPVRLAEGVLDVLLNPDAARKRADQAFSDIQSYGLARWIRQTEELFGALVEESASAIHRYRQDSHSRSSLRDHLALLRFRARLRAEMFAAGRVLIPQPEQGEMIL